MAVEINCDMGEGFSLYQLADDRALMPCIDVANIACGFHASDPTIMRRTVRWAKEFGVRVGAHPSLPDLQGFGRREMSVSADEVSAMVLYQVGALTGFLKAEDLPLNHIKPHGALYGMSAKEERIATAVCDAVKPFGVPLIGLTGTQHERACLARGVPFVSEFYIDLDYSPAGDLIITREHGARDPGAAADRALRAVEEGRVKATDGSELVVKAESLCLHSDTPNALEVARAVMARLRPHLAARAQRQV
jgi:5-oxoprolinase (ATP-hydrolysing) subunit A